MTHPETCPRCGAPRTMIDEGRAFFACGYDSTNTKAHYRGDIPPALGAVVSEFFWSCECESGWWRDSNATPEQPRCGVCMSTKRFFSLTPEQQAKTVQAFYSAQFGASAWLAVTDQDRDTVLMPRAIAVSSAGWKS